MTLTDTIRQALSEAGVPMSRAQLVDATGIEGEAISKLLYAAKKRGEFSVSVLDGKPAYAINADYVASRASPRTIAPARAPAAPVGTPAATKPPAPAPAPSPEAPAPAAVPSPAQKLVGFARSTSAMADETLEQAVRMTAPPDLVLALTQASRLLHAAALRLVGGAA